MIDESTFTRIRVSSWKVYYLSEMRIPFGTEHSLSYVNAGSINKVMRNASRVCLIIGSGRDVFAWGFLRISPVRGTTVYMFSGFTIVAIQFLDI